MAGFSGGKCWKQNDQLEEYLMCAKSTQLEEG